ncbi:MAG: DNA polymerase III subunit delta' [Actinomycetota bacterium]|nr:DNA polymerase III subunit delta' [Actinomycetota bacterium]
MTGGEGPTGKISCSGWEEIYGQDRAVGFLREILRRGEVPHALLFTGPRGIGKYSTALLFAAALLCASGEPDGCSSCRKVARGVHPDVHVLEAEGSVIRREQVTSLERELNRKPAEAAARVAIIDEAHIMNQEAANAFLKTLEEPPPGTYIILVAESKEIMLPTVISRSHEVRFSSLGRRDIEEFLMNREGLEPGEAERLARLSGGIFGRSLLWAREPELASYWNRGVELASTLHRSSLAVVLEEAEVARELLGEVETSSGLDEEKLEEYVRAMDKRSGDRLKKRWEERRKRETAKMRRQATLDMFDGMSSFYRDIMLLNLVEEGGRSASESLLLNLEWREEVERGALHTGTAEAMRRLEALQRARKAVEANVDLALVMDSLLLELRSIRK